MNLDQILKLDADLSARLRVCEEPGVLRTLAAFFGHSGDSWFWLTGMLILWWQGTEDWKFRAGVFIVAMLLTGFVVMILKYSIRRPRPQGNWGQIYRRTDPHSFPSGHAARSLMLPVVGLGLGPLWFGLVLLVWGPLVGLGRVAMGVHYLSDILVGWLVGIIMGILVVFGVQVFF
jgi:undecaprenyl-diphosphatase